VIAILLSLWAVVGVLAVVWFVLRGGLGHSKTRQLRLAKRQAMTPAVGDQDAEWIYGDRAQRRDTEPVEQARREAEAIVRGAKLKAQAILAGAERARDHVEAELAREQAAVAEKSERLSEFLANALEEVERASANGSANAHDLGELEERRKDLGSTE
jgi:hypothetical protein